MKKHRIKRSSFGTPGSVDLLRFMRTLFAHRGQEVSRVRPTARNGLLSLLEITFRPNVKVSDASRCSAYRTETSISEALYRCQRRFTQHCNGKRLCCRMSTISDKTKLSEARWRYINERRRDFRRSGENSSWYRPNCGGLTIGDFVSFRRQEGTVLDFGRMGDHRSKGSET